MNDKTQINLTDASPAQLAFLALNGSYGEKLVAALLLESIAMPDYCWIYYRGKTKCVLLSQAGDWLRLMKGGKL